MNETTHSLDGRKARQGTAELDEASLSLLLERFYAKVRHDPALGPIFAGAIADDAWPAHMARITGFWRSVLFKAGGYKGNPFAVHARLDGLTPALFERWLSLFGETSREVLSLEDAELVRVRALKIAESLQAGLFFRPDRVA